jgi:hypothetical protein
MVSQAVCSATCKDNRPCRAPALADGLCFVHSPLTAEARDRCRRENGRARMRRLAVLPDAEDVTFAGTQDVLRLLGQTASQVRRGELDCRVGNCLAYIAATALRAIVEGDLERRLAEVEALLAKLKEKQRHGTV